MAPRIAAKKFLIRACRMTAIACLLTAPIFNAGMTAAAAAPEEALDDMDRLIEKSGLIVRGHVINIEQGLRDTRVTFEIEQVFKGDLSLKTIFVTHRGGKHTVEPTEPSFMSYDRAILYLQAREQGIYTCAEGNRGNKTIRNDNVYISPDNSFLSIKIKPYQEALTARIKAVQAATGAPWAIQGQGAAQPVAARGSGKTL